MMLVRELGVFSALVSWKTLRKELHSVPMSSLDNYSNFVRSDRGYSRRGALSESTPAHSNTPLLGWSAVEAHEVLIHRFDTHKEFDPTQVRHIAFMSFGAAAIEQLSPVAPRVVLPDAH